MACHNQLKHFTYCFVTVRSSSQPSKPMHALIIFYTLPILFQRNTSPLPYVHSLSLFLILPLNSFFPTEFKLPNFILLYRSMIDRWVTDSLTIVTNQCYVMSMSVCIIGWLTGHVSASFVAMCCGQG